MAISNEQMMELKAACRRMDSETFVEADVESAIGRDGAKCLRATKSLIDEIDALRRTIRKITMERQDADWEVERLRGGMRDLLGGGHH